MLEKQLILENEKNHDNKNFWQKCLYCLEECTMIKTYVKFLELELSLILRKLRIILFSQTNRTIRDVYNII